MQDVVRLASGASNGNFVSLRMGGDGSRVPTKVPEIWQAVGGPPLHNGKPIPARYFEDNVRLIPVSGNMCRMEIMAGRRVIDAQNENGNVFFFDVQALLDAAP